VRRSSELRRTFLDQSENGYLGKKERLTYSRAWVRLSEINSKKKMMMRINWSRFYFSAPYYFGFHKTDAVGGA
jgi:hypothetical protein